MIERFQIWFDAHRRQVILFICFFLLSTISFALGYLFARETEVAPIVIERLSPLSAEEQ